MNRLITLVLLSVSLMFLNQTHAQSVSMVKLDGVNIVPTTTVTATFVVKKESIRSGPYARFSHKFLGVISPLTDKDIYTIVDSQLSYFNIDGGDQLGSCIDLSGFDNEVDAPVASFSKVTEDRLSSVTTSPESMARNAANMIFSLRKSRLDLITGEAGENVFNAGLESAMAEINRLESELLALFIGKHEVRYETKVFNIVPEKEKNTHIIVRFSPSMGIVSSDDINGQPIVLNVQLPKEVVATDGKRKKKSPKNVQEFLVPAQAVCQLFNGSEILAKLNVQIYQLGDTIELEIPEVE